MITNILAISIGVFVLIVLIVLIFICTCKNAKEGFQTNPGRVTGRVYTNNRKTTQNNSNPITVDHGNKRYTARPSPGYKVVVMYKENGELVPWMFGECGQPYTLPVTKRNVDPTTNDFVYSSIVKFEKC